MDASAPFQSTTRYVVERQLGDGGFGVVYKIFDRERTRHLALKVLRFCRPEAIYQFKREFRALADVSHPNLVGLHELVCEEGRWFFTMDLVEGSDFLEYVREDIGRLDGGGQTLPPCFAYDEVRLRSALGQLASGVLALHQAQKLHRDIKPSNVRVTPEGHLVLLDFGLVKEFKQDTSLPGGIVGTAAYMAPEQALADQVSEASDWYSVGVMLYEALTGHLPYQGSIIEMLMKKQSAEAPVPLPDGTPWDLAELCLGLLARNPADRPRGEGIRQSLGLGEGAVTALVEQEGSYRTLLGRKEEMNILQHALQESREGKPVVVHLRGASGIGKTALLEHFAEVASSTRHTVVLSGRCHERESVPFKAVDSLIDALSRHLRKISAERAASLMPREVWALARLFPVLERVAPIADAPRPRLEFPDRQELRRRGFAALRELLARLADPGRLILIIDDLHWGDLDSAALLCELLRGPDAPGMLLVLGYRPDEGEQSPLLRALLADARVEAQQIKILLKPLPDREAAALARSLLGTHGSDDLAGAIARESGGNPFFVHALVRAAPSRVGGALTLEEVIERWVADLPAEAARLLEVVALAGEPVHTEVALRAAELGEEEGRAAVATLRAARLLQRYGSHQDWLDVFHNRLRVTVMGRLSAEQVRAQHVRLAMAIELSGQADPERLTTHYEGAGDLQRASRYAIEAARRASAALAFERAAALYRRALRLGELDPEERRLLLRSLGDSLVNAGYAKEAAESYLEAAEGAEPEQMLELRCAATAQLLVSGRIDEGMRLLRTLLAQVGCRLPCTPRRALAALLARRLWLRLRGLGFRERSPSQIPPVELRRIDTIWAVGLSLSTSDNIMGSCFQAKNLLLSLRAGDPARVARAMALEATYLSVYGGRAGERAAELLARTKELNERIGDAYLGALIGLAIGTTSWFKGEWRLAFQACDQALCTFAEQCAGVAWELDTASIFGMAALAYLGEWKELCRRLPEVEQIARERSDLYLDNWMRVRWLPIQLLARDDPAEASRSAAEGLASSPTRGFSLTHWWGLYSRIMAALYQGDAGTAWATVEESRPALKRSLISRIQVHRVQLLYMRASAALLGSEQGGGKNGASTLLQQAERDAEKIGREWAGWASAHRERILAGVQRLRGQPELALQHLNRAETQFELQQMKLHAAAVRRQRGRLIGGDAGGQLVAAADAAISEEGVERPDRLANMLVPGFAELG